MESLIDEVYTEKFEVNGCLLLINYRCKNDNLELLFEVRKVLTYQRHNLLLHRGKKIKRL